MVSIFNVCQTVLDSENSQTVEANQRVKTEQIKNFPAIAWYGRGWTEVTVTPLVLPSLDKGIYGAVGRKFAVSLAKKFTA
jgi:hypothetical protein